MTKKFLIISIFVFIILTATIWLGLKKFVVYLDLFSPLPSLWVEVRLLGERVFYGHVAGIAGGIMKLNDVYFLEKFFKAGASSENFSLGGVPDSDNQKDILVKKNFPVFIPITSILYWESLDPSLEILRYLK